MSRSHRRFKDQIYEQFARLGKALSAPKRLELLDLLAQGPRTVEHRRFRVRSGSTSGYGR